MATKRLSAGLVGGMGILIGWAAGCGLAPALASTADAPGPPGSAPSVRPPMATLRIVPVAASPKDPNAITVRIPGATEAVAVGRPA
jgi:hypothetical protein